ncbi:MAG TPA: DNA internalization-related competence protein ComEC/Rec2 [Gemmatimonadales bacterium]
MIPVAYGAGLATGLVRFWGAALVVCAVWLVLARSPLPRLLAGVAACGALAGAFSRALDAEGCAASMPDGRVEVTVRAIDASAGRGLVRAELPGAGCAGTIDVRWRGGAAVAAGTVGRATGQWTTRPRTGGRSGGVLAVARFDTISIDPTFPESARNGIVRQGLRLYGDRAPLVEALVLGTRGTLDPAVRDAFAHAGLVHLLSISGFHVGLLSAWVALVARLLGASRARALAAGSVLGIVYVGFLGWPAPGTRAAALAGVLALAYRRQRSVQANALLALTCLLVMLVSPWSVFDLGGWLSAAALWGATAATRWSDRAWGEGFLSRTIASSVGATLATAPITAAALGAVALAGIALNLVAIPLAAVAVPGVAASLIVAPLLDGLAGALAAGSGIVLHLLEVMAELGARVPGGHVIVPQEPRSALPWLVLLVVAAWVAGRRNTRREAARRLLLAGTACLWLLFAAPLLRARSGDAGRGLTLHFLDVGQGDGAAIRTPGGHWVLVDAGPRIAGSDAGRRVVAPFLARHGARRVTALIVSHAHLDHFGGVPAVLERLGVDALLEPGDHVADPAYGELLGLLAASGIRWQPARRGLSFELDSVRFEVLHPDTAWPEWGMDVNEGSAVVRVAYRDFSALFAGDAGFSAERRLAGRVGRVDVLKVGHHGSSGSSGEAWLAELAPRVAIVSVGRNSYGHPAADAMARLRSSRADVRRTDTDGTITITTDGRTMTVGGRHGAAHYRVD